MAITWSELKRRRVIRAMGAYFVGAWVLIQVASATFPPLGLPEWSQRALILALAAGIAPALVLAWVYDFTGRGIVRTAASPLPAVAFRGVETPVAAPDSDGAPRALPADASIAVLPFADLSPSKDQDWFCDGLAEEIIDALCCVPRLRVASRTASFRFRDGAVDPREIARTLGVGAVLEGSVRKAGDRVRITAQLIDGTSGYHLWSERYDRGLEDVFAIQSEIARKVSGALRVSLTCDVCELRDRHAPRNPHAHEFYLRGRQLMRQLTTAAWLRAPAMFRRAIELDPDYAQAHAGLVDILAQLVLWRMTPSGEAVLAEATRAAHRALELAPDLAESHVAFAHVRWLTGDPEGAARAFARAIELNPEFYEAWYYYARLESTAGDVAHAAELFYRAWQMRPDDYTVLALVVSGLLGAGQRERALEVARVAADGLARQVELDPDDARAHYMLAGVLAQLGRADEGVSHVEAALRLRPEEFATLYNAACFYNLAGDRERAMTMLERAVRSGAGNFGWLAHDPDLASLRDDTRFATLMAQLAASPAP